MGDCNYPAKDPISAPRLTRRARIFRGSPPRGGPEGPEQRQNNENYVGRVVVIEVRASRSRPADFDLSKSLVDNPRVVRIKPPTEEVM
jgi:hypothetical protein